jgi:hypothetical protein
VEEVSIIAPCYLADVDRTAGSASETDLTFGVTTWASGQYSTGPEWVGRISAYAVLDEIVKHYMDREEYPNLNVRRLMSDGQNGCQFAMLGCCHYGSLSRGSDGSKIRSFASDN